MALGDMALGDMALGDMALGDMALGDMALGDMNLSSVIKQLFVEVHSWVLRSTDPLGPTDLDPDSIRDGACDVTAPSNICNPPEVTPREFDGPDLSWLANLLTLLLVLALVAALVWLISRFVDGRRLDSIVDDEDRLDVDESIDEAVDARVIDHETPPDRWRRRAAEHREREEYRESVRCEYRALVGDLARAGHVDEIPGRTSGEERAQVRELAPGLGAQGAAVSAQFDMAADTFDSAWFDNAVVKRSDDERFVAASRSVLDVVLAGSGARRLGGRRS
jgi:hypothetical protein